MTINREMSDRERVSGLIQACMDGIELSPDDVRTGPSPFSAASSP
jgi:hypothetical protein